MAGTGCVSIQIIQVNRDFNDDQGHGSHCAGVIGAKHNDVGISGINNKVQLMALKFLSKKGAGTLAGTIEAINYAVEKGADVINASWGASILKNSR